MNLKHFVTWDVTIEELKEIAEHLKECPIISIPLTDDVELTIRLKELKKVKITSCNFTSDGDWHWFQTTT